MIYRDIWYIPFYHWFSPDNDCDDASNQPDLSVLAHTEDIGKSGWFYKAFDSLSNHRAHHSREIKELDKNYGGILMAWDHLFQDLS